MSKKEVLAAYNSFNRIPIQILNVDMEKSLKIACKYNIYAYDAYYLEAASRLKLPLITFDKLMKNIALKLNIRVLTEK